MVRDLLRLYPRGLAAADIAGLCDLPGPTVHGVLNELAKAHEAYSVRGAPIRWFSGQRVVPVADAAPSVAHPLAMRGPGRCCAYYPAPGPGREQRRKSCLCADCADRKECEG